MRLYSILLLITIIAISFCFSCIESTSRSTEVHSYNLPSENSDSELSNNISGLNRNEYCNDLKQLEHWKMISIPGIDLTGFHLAGTAAKEFILLNSDSALGILKIDDSNNVIGFKNISQNFKFSSFRTINNQLLLSMSRTELSALNNELEVEWVFQNEPLFSEHNCGFQIASNESSIVVSYLLSSKLTVLNLDGSLLWHYYLKSPSRLYCLPAIDAKGNVIFIDSEGIMHCLDNSGKVQWQVLLSYATQTYNYDVPFINLVIIGDGVVYAEDDAGIKQFDIETGLLLREYSSRQLDVKRYRSILGRSALDRNNSLILRYASDEDVEKGRDRLLKLDDQFNAIWNIPIERNLGSLFDKPIAAANGILVVADDCNVLFISKLGELIWKYTSGYDIRWLEVYSESQIFIDTEEGIVLMYH